MNAFMCIGVYLLHDNDKEEMRYYFHIY